MKILIMGLPGSGKTYLAERLSQALRAVFFNADRVRATINKSLGFSPEDRVEHARRMGWMCQFVKDSGQLAIADFVCPTEAARKAFDPDFIIWMNTIEVSRYEDTNKLFEPPTNADVIITDFNYHFEDLSRDIGHALLRAIHPAWIDLAEFDDHAPTAFLLGRYQPFHDGHLQLCLEALGRVGQICLAVRNTTGLEKNPFSYEDVAQRIVEKFDDKWNPKTMKIIQVPNITSITYGRDVGYTIDKIDLDEAIKSISATKVRAEMGL